MKKRLSIFILSILLAVPAFAGPLQRAHLAVIGSGAASAPPASVSATDDFNRSNADALGSLSGGTYSWSEVAGDIDIESNAAHNAGGVAIAVLSTAVNIDDLTVQADINAEGNAWSSPGVVFWYTDTNNYWYARFAQADTQMVELRQVSSGTDTEVDDGGGNGYFNSTTYNMRVVTSGTNIKVYFNEEATEVIDYTAASAGTGNVGIIILRDTASGWIDDFSVTEN